MSFTYASLSDAIQKYCENDETDFVANIPTFIKNAEDRILNAALLPVFRRNVTGTTSVGNQYLALPSDYMAPYSLAVDNNGAYSYLLLKDVSYIREVFPQPSDKALPRFYATYSDESFILGPTPDGNYAVEMHYYHRPTSIVDAGTSWLGTNAPTVLLYACLIGAYTFMKGEADIIENYGKQYMSALSELKDLAEGHMQTDDYRGGAVRRPRQ